MTNKEKFKEVFGEELAESIDFDSACTRISQTVALRSMYIKGVDNICEWFNAEYKEQTNTADCNTCAKFKAHFNGERVVYDEWL